MYDLCALGELLIDFTPSGTDSGGSLLFGRNPGGGVANMAAMFANLGGRAAFVGKVGDDAFGRFLEKTLRDAKVDTAGLVKDPAFLTTLAIVQLEENGERDFSFYRREGADLMFTWEEVDRSIIDASRVFHFGAVSVSDEPCRTTVKFAAEYAKSRGKIISYDPNYRPFLWKSDDEAKTEIGNLIPMADVLKVSEEEMFFLTGSDRPEEGARILLERGPAIVLVSLGARGAFFLCAGGGGYVDAYRLKTVDTTGAGDAFLGALHWRLRGKNLDALKTVAPSELRDAASFACAAGSLTTTKKGGIPAMPTLAEIEALRNDVPRV